MHALFCMAKPCKTPINTYMCERMAMIIQPTYMAGKAIQLFISIGLKSPIEIFSTVFLYGKLEYVAPFRFHLKKR